jgi:dihydropteroate synthase
VKIFNSRESRIQIEKIGSDAGGVAAMFRKTLTVNLKIHNLKLPQVHILKQEMLAAGGDAAVAREVLVGNIDRTDVLLMGTIKQLHELCKRLLLQPFSMKKLSQEIKEILAFMEKKEFVWKAKGREILLGTNTLIMGILNVTPDSFSDGGLYYDHRAAVARVVAMIDEGADIIDIGGESTRPGAPEISEKEETDRVIPVIEALRKKNRDIIITVDTYKSSVADAALSAGADAVNDISGLTFDKEMKNVVAGHKAGLILMHTRGKPGEMQKNTEYSDFMEEVLEGMRKSISEAVQAGISMESIVIDPGIGFGKSFDHNLFILKNMQEFKVLGLPVLAGPSRKAFIGKITGKDAPLRDDASMAAVSIAVFNGADILRVHDVAKAKDAVRVSDAIKNAPCF